MFYQLAFDMDRIDEFIKKGTNTIYAETTNMDEIEYENMKKDFFDNIIYAPRVIREWPDVEFYYSSKASDRESDYLLNVKRWPVVHVRVMEEFTRNGIAGIRYFPIRLIDVVTRRVNLNYMLMYIENFIDGFDMERSEYVYNEKYDFYTFIPMKTYLNQEICSGYDIFRCAKSAVEIYVSEKIRELVRDNQWIGFAFYEQQ